MDIIADAFLASGAFGAAIYCYILAQRLRRLQTLESGMGGAIAVLSGQVDDLSHAIERARRAATQQSNALEDLTRRGEITAARLELLLASMHDLTPQEERPQAKPLSAQHPHETTRRPRFLRRKGESAFEEVTS